MSVDVIFSQGVLDEWKADFVGGVGVVIDVVHGYGCGAKPDPHTYRAGR